MIDYPFILTNLEREWARTKEFVKNQQKWIAQYQDEIERKELALRYDNVRRWEYELGIKKSREKIVECDIKLGPAIARIPKLEEQMDAVRKFINQ